jgi:hypothetical protein
MLANLDYKEENLPPWIIKRHTLDTEGITVKQQRTKYKKTECTTSERTKKVRQKEEELELEKLTALERQCYDYLNQTKEISARHESIIEEAQKLDEEQKNGTQNQSIPDDNEVRNIDQRINQYSEKRTKHLTDLKSFHEETLHLNKKLEEKAKSNIHLNSLEKRTYDLTCINLEALACQEKKHHKNDTECITEEQQKTEMNAFNLHCIDYLNQTKQFIAHKKSLEVETYEDADKYTKAQEAFNRELENLYKKTLELKQILESREQHNIPLTTNKEILCKTTILTNIKYLQAAIEK